jgi:NitT/TauT family transport system substrate-binding protein
MKKRIIMMIAMAMMVFTGCQAKEEMTQTSLKFGMMPSDSAAPLVVAEQQGYFKEEGIDVSLELFFSAKDRDSAFHTGNLDGADYDLITAMMTPKADFDLVVGSSSEGSFKFLGAKTDDPKKLEGTKLGLSRNTIIEFYTDKFLKTYDMTEESITKEEIPQIPVRLQMLQEGQIGGAVLPDPLATLAIKKGASLIKDSVEFENQVSVYVFNREFAEKNPLLVEKFYSAYDKGVDYINSHEKNEYLPLLIEKLNFPAPITDSYKPLEYAKRNMPTEASVKEVNEWLLEKKLIEKEVEYKDIILQK